MKLRKAIKLAAAGAVVGAIPMMATANQAGFGTAPIVTFSGSSAGVSAQCGSGGWVCDSANAITDDGFIMYKATDTNGNNYYITGIVDNGEGNFNTASMVGEENNSSGNAAGVYSKTNVSEIGATDDDFTMDTTVTTQAYSDSVDVGGANGSALSVSAHQKIDINQSIYDNASFTAFNTGFNYTNGTTDSQGLTYETFDINLNVDDGSAATGDLLQNSFQLLETKVDGGTAGSGDSVIIGKTLMIDQYVADQADLADTFTQAFIQNEAAGSAVADAGIVTAGAGGAYGSGTFTFQAGETLAVKTLEQNLNAAAADFGLSDAANESNTTQETGVDNFLGVAAMAGTYNNTNLGDPFVSF
jgi:hypothetical protein